MLCKLDVSLKVILNFSSPSILISSSPLRIFFRFAFVGFRVSRMRLRGELWSVFRWHLPKERGEKSLEGNKGRRKGSIKCGLKYERCIFQV